MSQRMTVAYIGVRYTFGCHAELDDERLIADFVKHDGTENSQDGTCGKKAKIVQGKLAYDACNNTEEVCLSSEFSSVFFVHLSRLRWQRKDA